MKRGLHYLVVAALAGSQLPLPGAGREAVAVGAEVLMQSFCLGDAQLESRSRSSLQTRLHLGFFIG